MSISPTDEFLVIVMNFETGLYNSKDNITIVTF